MKTQRLNDEEREQWINNNEVLYKWWRLTKRSMSAFIRENKKEIDYHIREVING